MEEVCFIDNGLPTNLLVVYGILSDLQRRGILKINKVNCGNEYMISYAIDDGMSWVPCSVRLPDNYERVLISHEGGVTYGWYNGRYWERGASTKHSAINTVTAWMPLPPRFRGETKE